MTTASIPSVASRRRRRRGRVFALISLHFKGRSLFLLLRLMQAICR